MLSSSKYTWLTIICLTLGLADLYVINFDLAPMLMAANANVSGPELKPGPGPELKLEPEHRLEPMPEPVSNPEPFAMHNEEVAGNDYILTGSKENADKSTAVNAESKPVRDIPVETESDKQKTDQKPLSLDTTIFFEAMAYELNEAQKIQINDLLEKFSDISQHEIIVEGHADRTGNDRIDNNWISLLRAQAVADYLRSKGIPAEQIQVKSYGASKPMDEKDNYAAWARNRRVTLKIL